MKSDGIEGCKLFWKEVGKKPRKIGKRKTDAGRAPLLFLELTRARIGTEIFPHLSIDGQNKWCQNNNCLIISCLKRNPYLLFHVLVTFRRHLCGSRKPAHSRVNGLNTRVISYNQFCKVPLKIGLNLESTKKKRKETLLPKLQLKLVATSC